MRTRLRRGLLGATLMLAACAEQQVREPESAEAGTPAVAGVARSALALAADKLIEADRAFAARVLERGAPEAFHDFFDGTGVRLLPDGEPPSGPQAVGASLERGQGLLSWDPRYAEVFAPGDWGLTWGDWQSHEPGAGGRRIGEGRYMSVWKKQRDGSWKVHMNLLPAPAIP